VAICRILRLEEEEERRCGVGNVQGKRGRYSGRTSSGGLVLSTGEKGKNYPFSSERKGGGRRDVLALTEGGICNQREECLVRLGEAFAIGSLRAQRWKPPRYVKR